MDLVLSGVIDAVATLVLAAVRAPRRRAARPPRPVVPTPWLTAAAGALVVLALLVGAGAVWLGWAIAQVLADDMFIFLGILLLPVAVGGLALAVAFEAWAVPLVVDLSRADGRARRDVGIIGGVTTASALMFFMLLPRPFTALPLALGAVVTAVAMLPAAWQSVDDTRRMPRSIV